MQSTPDLSIKNLDNNWDKLVAKAIELAPQIATSIISGILILVVGLWIIRLVKKLTQKIFEKQDVDISLRRFLGNLIDWALKILLFIIVTTQFGIQTSAFIAIIGAAGLAIGLALQGSLSNFAGGVLILTLKPFRVGDFITSSNDVAGTVTVIDIFNTRIVTPQNQVVVVPNGNLSNSNITNFSAQGTRRTWFNIGVSYSADLRQAKDIIGEVIKKNEFAHAEPAPQIMVTELGDSAVNLSVRVTTDNEHFWAMNENLIIDCKAALENAGIEIPFPQRDIHIRSNVN
ncbi:mechanosensitive ion channel family protein [Pedobacter helvus]|uniref:Mechanosensitive ion channel family protein n=1 Tax=Pedobacter helvus TaxID=2563444 RepID=A0ABW9JI75_9SPHI|nr:mechanosensitive ion channel family protein [Pedobacter ureilyticus]